MSELDPADPNLHKRILHDGPSTGEWDEIHTALARRVATLEEELGSTTFRYPFIQSLYKYRPIVKEFDERLQFEIEDGCVWAGGPFDQNDDRECKFEGAMPDGSGMASSMFYSGIVSYSESPTLLLQWAYYSSGHRGYCLEYDRLSCPVASQARPVLYSDARRRLADIEEGQPAYAAFVKPTAWRHEQEWRFISIDFRVPIPDVKVTGVIVGSKTDREHRAKIWEAAKAKGIRFGRIDPRRDSELLDVEWEGDG